jgi:hypothetical protein
MIDPKEEYPEIDWKRLGIALALCTLVLTL